jgi:hypothetical protein
VENSIFIFFVPSLIKPAKSNDSNGEITMNFFHELRGLFKLKATKSLGDTLKSIVL